MRSYAVDRLMKNAVTSLPGSLENVIQLELFNVLDQFFKDTSIWTEDIPFSVSINDKAGVIYYIEPESTSSIFSLLDVSDVNQFHYNACMELPGEVTLFTPFGQDGTLTAKVALTINDPMKSDGFPEFPEWILEKYHLCILDGVLGRMMAQPAKPYTNERLAVAHLKLFEQGKSIAATLATRQNVHGRQAWRFPQSFATRSRR